MGYGNGGYRGRLFWVAFPGGHGVFYRRVKGGSLGGERRKYLSDDPAQCGRDMMEQCIGGRLGSFFTQAESMDVTAARLSGTRQFTGRGRGQVGQLLHASKTGMLQVIRRQGEEVVRRQGERGRGGGASSAWRRGPPPPRGRGGGEAGRRPRGARGHGLLRRMATRQGLRRRRGE